MLPVATGMAVTLTLLALRTTLADPPAARYWHLDAVSVLSLP